MELGKLLASEQARELERQIGEQERLAAADREYRTLADVAASCRQVCRLVAARLRARGTPNLKVLYPQPNDSGSLPYVWAYGWSVACRVLLEDGRLTMGTIARVAPRLGNADSTVASGQDYGLVHAGVVSPLERFFVVGNQDPLIVIPPDQGHAGRLQDEDLALQTCRAPFERDTDTDDGRALMWRDRTDNWDIRWYPLGLSIASLLTTR